MGDGQLRFGCFGTGVLVLFLSTQKQIFDFLGYMWAPMLGNFLNIVFTIFVCFGCWHRRVSFLICYLVWSLPLWIPWNAFLICFYTEVGGLRRSQDLLSFGTRSFSWWLANGYGCRPEYNFSSPLLDDAQLIMYPPLPSRVTGCFMEYHMVEALQSVVQLCATCLCCLLCSLHLYVLISRLRAKGSSGSASGRGDKSGAAPGGAGSIYSIEYSPRSAAAATDETAALYSNVMDANRVVQMTPRRVKRRSYTRSSARSARSHRAAAKRSTLNSLPGGSLRLKSTNPVTRLMEAADARPSFRSMNDSSTSNDEAMRQQQHGTAASNAAAAADRQLPQQLPGYGQINPAYESSRPNSLYSNAASHVGPAATASATSAATAAAPSSRPPSALTSYSNFHGQRRPATSIMAAGGANVMTQENIIQQQQQQNQGESNPAAADTSFDDLPPPPPPLATAQQEQHQHQQECAATAATAATAAAQVPVPQQRGSSGRFKNNEYVNMPIVQQHQQQLMQQQQQQHRDGEGFSSSTLRADGHLLAPSPAAAATRPGNTANKVLPPPLPLRANGFSSNVTTSEDDYGFSGRTKQQQVAGAGRWQPVQRHQQQAQQQQDKWYLNDSMRPIGASVHGGNCKCYRCQRKLTAI